MGADEKTRKIEFLKALLKRVLERRGDPGDGILRIQAGGVYKGGAPYFSKCAGYNILKSRKDVARLWKYRRGWAAAGR